MTSWPFSWASRRCTTPSPRCRARRATVRARVALLPTHPAKGEVVSDNTANQRPAPSEPTTIAEVLQGGQPMGDLRRFVIEDLTPEEEDEFFRILEEA